ncbi:MAG: DUF1624 domain-containing protein [Spirochaetes bacterium]|nr:MAG: DUF1624 domain-containing protein [Spirochaetota bacterium]
MSALPSKTPAHAHRPERNPGLDALRGLAIILMVQQHLMAWLWSEPWVNMTAIFKAHPFMMALNSTGAFSAPLFVMLAGAGSAYLFASRTRPGRTLAAHGLCILALGYVLNFAAPHWFTIGSWYVLHLVGISLILAGGLNRLPSWSLALLALAALAGAVLAQTWLDSPLFFNRTRISDYGQAGGVARLALAEGHFPILPWTAFFIAGIPAARLVMKNSFRAVALAGFACLVAGAALALAYRHGFAFATYGTFYRAFVIQAHFYPGQPPLLLMLGGGALVAVALFAWIGHRGLLTSEGPLASAGRASLSIFMIHVMLFMELSRLIGTFKAFSEAETLAIVAAVLALFMTGAYYWKRIGYRYGFEWLIRLPAG